MLEREPQGQIKTLRISKQAAKCFAAFSWVDNWLPLELTGAGVGIDMKLASLITTSDRA